MDSTIVNNTTRQDYEDMGLLADIGIIGGFIAFNVAIDRARPYWIPLAGSLANRPRPVCEHLDPTQLSLIVWHLLSGACLTIFLCTIEVILQVTPQVSMYGQGSRIIQIHPGWIQVRENTVYIVRGLKNVITSLRKRRKGRSSLIRWIGSSLPSRFFSINAQRIHILTKTSDEEPRFGDVIHSDDHRPRLTTSFRCLPDSLIGDLDIECGNSEEGIFVAFAKSSQLSDLETDMYDTDATESEGTWGSNFSVNFSLEDPRCSTPKAIRMGTDAKGKFDGNATFTIQDESSVAQAATDAKVVALEAELNTMKAMLALILENQTKVKVENPSTTRHEVALTPKQASELQSFQIPFAPVKCCPPPPPPPPPPLPPSLVSGATAGVIKLKVGSGSGLSQLDTISKPKENHPPSLTDVLKALPNVKLRQIPRSPGGTPLKVKKMSDPSDLGSVMAAALRKRYARIQSPISSEDENDSCTDKENVSNNDIDDSFSVSPAFYKPPIKLLKSPATGASIRVRDRSGSGKIKRTNSIKDLGGATKEMDVLPMFGQHLLKRRRSTSQCKQFGLREQNTQSQN